MMNGVGSGSATAPAVRGTCSDTPPDGYTGVRGLLRSSKGGASVRGK